MERRSQEMKDRYQQALDSGKVASFDTEPAVMEFVHWRVVENKYPYDLMAKKHRLLVPKRHIPDSVHLNSEEAVELSLIKRLHCDEYDILLENTRKTRTVEDWYHIHMIEYV